MRESDEQAALFQWASIAAYQFPELALMYHCPNGGRRDKKEAMHLKRQGVKAGVPDVFLPVARGEYNGLYIELKVGNNKPTVAQKKWLRDLQKQGYAAFVCYGWQEARLVIVAYLKGDLK